MDGRDWVRARRDRTRRLIQLGGLVEKSELADLAGDDRALVLGALLEAADRLRADADGGAAAARWRARGREAFRPADRS